MLRKTGAVTRRSMRGRLLLPDLPADAAPDRILITLKLLTISCFPAEGGSL